MRRKRIVAILMLLLISSVFTLSACKALIYYDDPARYSTAQHVDRIKKIVQEKYIGDGEFTDFAVYPLYDKDDNVLYYLVEFEPCGFLYVLAEKPNLLIRTKMYKKNDVGRCPKSHVFSRYRISDTQPQEFEGKTWKNKEKVTVSDNYVPESMKWYESDEKGIIVYHSSPYKAANVQNEKKYVLPMEEYRYVPAIKRGEKYLNLVSMEEFVLSNEFEKDKKPYIYISFYGKSGANLSERGNWHYEDEI